MKHSIVGRSLVLSALAAVLTTASCADLNTFVTGEVFSRAPEDAPRIEVELVVEVEDSFLEAVEIDDEDALADSVSELALSLADVGMRFYPVPSDQYDSDSSRPPYVMTLRVQDLAVNIDHDLVEEEGQEPWIDSSVTSLDATVTASIERRRDDAPPLVVGHTQDTGRVRVKYDPEDFVGQTTYVVTWESEEPQELLIVKQDVLDAVEKALVDTLRDLVKAVDREFSLPEDND